MPHCINCKLLLIENCQEVRNFICGHESLSGSLDTNEPNQKMVSLLYAADDISSASVLFACPAWCPLRPSKTPLDGQKTLFDESEVS